MDAQQDARPVLPWEYFERISENGNDLQVQCKLCLPKITILSGEKLGLQPKEAW